MAQNMIELNLIFRIWKNELHPCFGKILGKSAANLRTSLDIIKKQKQSKNVAKQPKNGRTDLKQKIAK